ncbi:MAG: sigma-70 family RNA polymerase sigma factor [Chloroflexota bacterium]
MSATATVTPTLTNVISDVTPTLCKFAAHHTNTHYSPTVDGLAMEAQDLYQVAISAILRECKDGDTKSYVLTKADWRMRNKATSDRKMYYERIGLETDLQPEDSDDDGDTVMDIIAVDHSNPEDVLIEREVGMAISGLVKNMKPDWEIVVVLMRDGFTLPEISAKIGISYDAVWKRVVRIREMFQMAGLSPAALM